MNCTGNCNQGRFCTCRNEDRNKLPDFLAVITISAALWVLGWILVGVWSAS